jgi:LuxR family maltose regulon positive regulatory protein
MSVAATKGLVRTIADEPWHLEPLLGALAGRSDVDAAHLDAVSAALRSGANAAAAALPATGAANDLLSQREGQVLRLVASGLSNKELSRKLFISENTVETHLRRINDKLGVRSRTQAVARAREMGLV